jgi:hypothetical protein
MNNPEMNMDIFMAAFVLTPGEKDILWLLNTPLEEVVNSLMVEFLTGACPVPLWRDGRGQGALYKMILHCREAPACLSRPNGVAGELQ